MRTSGAILAAASLFVLGLVLVVSLRQDEDQVPHSLLSVQLQLPKGTKLGPGDRLRGYIGGYKFEGKLESNSPTKLPHLQIASATTSLAEDPVMPAASNAQPTTTELSVEDSGEPSTATFTADSDVYYPPGTVVSGWVNGKYFRGVVAGAGESEESRFSRRVGRLEDRVSSEEWRRGIRKQNDEKIQKVIDRIKELETKMNNAYRKAQQPRTPTLIRGNVVGFHFHGSLQPAGIAHVSKFHQENSAESSMLAEGASPLSSQMSTQSQLLAKVENLEKEVKQAQ